MPQPNIVLIVADDMGYGDFGVFNEGLAKTPTLDQLVSESVCLTQHYSASCVCAPARAGLITGRYPHRTGAIDTLEGRGLDRLALREVTMGDMFKSAGYVTGLIGKWHLGAVDPRYHPNARGFDEFVGFRGGWMDYYEWKLDYNGTPRQADGRYLTDVFTDEAADFIARHHNQPFFLHLTYNAPHGPFQAREEDLREFLANDELSRGVAIIYAMIYRMDVGIQRLLEELDRHGIADNTIVLFTSDNGPQFGHVHGLDINRYNCGFNGSKGNVYEGGIRLPMIVRWPAGLDGGRHFDQMVHFTDWLPTLCAAAGVDIPDDLQLDGWNVLPVLRGEGGKVNTRRFWQWNRYTPLGTCNAAMRDGPWKLVRPSIKAAQVVSQADLAMDVRIKYHPEAFTDICRDPEPDRDVPPPPSAQLYNLEDDPGEQSNLADAEPERTRRMLRELETWFESVEADQRSIEDEW